MKNEMALIMMKNRDIFVLSCTNCRKIPHSNGTIRTINMECKHDLTLLTHQLVLGNF